MKHFFTSLIALATSLTAVAQPGCSQIIQASFISAVQGNIVVVSNTSQSQFPQATTYQWNFGDGTVTDVQNVTHVYDAPGTYLVCLYAIVENCVDTVCEEVVIGGGDPCLALADVVTTLVPQQGGVSFAYANVPSYANTMWYFGDGTSSDDAQGFHQYAEPGTYTVCLWAWFIIEGTTDTCSSETCDPVTIEGGEDPCEGLEAGFFANPSPNGVQFSNGTAGTGFSTTWSWTFGDGTTSNDAQPFHEYPEPGAYLVCLTAISIYEQQGGGAITCLDSVCQEVVIPGEGSPCNALNADFNPAATGLSVNIQNAQVDPAWSYSWSFGDGTIGDGPNPFHVYDEPGEYQICLIVGTYDPLAEDSCSEDHCEWVIIGGGDPCAGLQADFQANVGDVMVWFSNTTTGTGFQTTWFWTFGDGTTSNDAQPSHIFPGLDTYQVCLVATSIYEQQGGGLVTCQDSVCQLVITGTGSPCDQLSAEWDALGNGPTINFQNIGITAGNSYDWDFGDGSTGEGPNPFHIYDVPGEYYVCLIVGTYDPTTQDSCFEDHCEWITIGQGGTACDSLWTASFEFGHQGNVYTFYNTSNTQGTEMSTQWTFGDGTFGNGSQLIHTYTASGNYTVCMTITGLIPGTNDSCQVESCQNIDISVGLEDLAEESLIHAWPLPFDGTLQLEGAGLSGNTRFTLMDMTGRVIDDRSTLNRGRMTLEYADLPPGTYVLRLRNALMEHSLRVVKR